MTLGGSNSDSVAGDQIRAFVERIERMNEERKAIADDIKEIYAEAKGNGFDTKALKIIVRRREQDPSERMELEAIVELYEVALGIRPDPREDDEDEPRAPAPARESAKDVPDHSSDLRNMVESTTQDTSNSGTDSAETAALVTTHESAATGERHSHPQITATEVAADNGGEESGTLDSLPATLNDACLNALKLRPHCLAAKANTLTKCGGHGKITCAACLQAHADAEGFSP